MIQPLGSRLLIEPVQKQEFTTDSGIIIGDVQVPQSIKATVVAVGPDADGYAEGDTVFVSQFAPTEVRATVKDKTMTVPCEDVLAKLVKD
jgi:co-chaperonin GroES (HSP10)